jgi:hypothetical protein
MSFSKPGNGDSHSMIDLADYRLGLGMVRPGRRRQEGGARKEAPGRRRQEGGARKEAPSIARAFLRADEAFASNHCTAADFLSDRADSLARSPNRSCSPFLN